MIARFLMTDQHWRQKIEGKNASLEDLITDAQENQIELERKMPVTRTIKMAKELIDVQVGDSMADENNFGYFRWPSEVDFDSLGFK